MHLQAHPTEIAEALLKRSICSVQVAAVLVDDYGVFSWGWNSAGDGYGEHAEAHAIRRANRKRLKGSIMYTAARRKRNGRWVISKPCQECEKLLKGVTVIFRDNDGHWRHS